MIAAFVLAAVVSTADLEKSVALLFAQDEFGGQQMKCTATAVAREGNETIFLTAAHCVTTEDAETKKLAPTREPLFLSTDELTKKVYVRAKIREIGVEKHGYDYAIISAPLEMPTIPIGDEREENPHVALINIAAPRGIGKVLSFGHVAMRFIDRPLIETSSHIDWSGAMLVSVDEVAGGSSGSAMVSQETGKVIGVLVGTYGSGSGLTIATPASRIHAKDKDNVLFALDNASGSPRAKTLASVR